MVLDLIDVKNILAGIDLTEEETQTLLSNIEEVAFGVIEDIFREESVDE